MIKGDGGRKYAAKGALIMKDNKGQTMIEALFVVVFVSIFMLCILQVCIMIINDMSANEAAFIAMRSAAVTEAKNRKIEIKDRTQNYFRFINPLGFYLKKGIVLTSKEAAESVLRRNGQNEEEDIESAGEGGDNSVTIWEGGKDMRELSGGIVKRQTVKIYYYTDIFFGSFFTNVKRGKRYQSARSRLFPSPDDKFYYKAYPNAKNFDDGDNNG